MKLKTLILNMFNSGGQCPVRGMSVWGVFLIVLLNSFSVSVYSQDNVYWRSAAITGNWEYGSSCDFSSSDDAWYNTTISRSSNRPDCYGANIIYFDNSVYPEMYLNSLNDFAVNQIQFITTPGNRIINAVGSRSLWFKQRPGKNAKIENYVASTIQTFNADINIEVGAFMEFNPVSGGLIFNNPIINYSANIIKVFGANQVTFSGNISGTPGLTIDGISGNATVVFTGVSKTYSGPTTIMSGTTLKISSNQSLGDIVLNSGGNLIIDAGKTLTITGTWTGGGTITNNGTIVLTGPSAFPGSGTTVSGMTNLTINRAAGVTLDKALSVSGVLTLTNGVLTTTGTNLLTLTNTATSAITGGSTSSYISGPVQWTFPASLATGSTYVVPVGKGGVYLPMSVIDPTTGAGTTTITAEAFTGNSGGTAGSPLISLSTTEYWSLASSGNLTNHKLSLTRQSAAAPNNRIGRSTTLAGTYLSVGGTPSGNSIINSGNTGAGTAQYFVMAIANSINVANSNPLSNGDYTTLAAAFSAINGQSQTGNNIVVTVNGSTTETATASLNQNGNPWTSLVIYPTGTGYSISGDLPGSSLIVLNGADNVTFNGSLNGTGVAADLTISNTSSMATSGTSTIRLQADAISNTITYCNVLGSATMAVGTDGGNIWFATASG